MVEASATLRVAFSQVVTASASLKVAFVVSARASLAVAFSDPRGSYRGVMDTTERDALDIFKKDTVTVTDSTQPHHYYDGVDWQTSGYGTATPEAGRPRALGTSVLYFFDDKGILEANAFLSYIGTPGTNGALVITSPTYSGAGASTVVLSSLAGGSSQVVITAETLQISAIAGIVGNGHYVSGAGRTNGADTDFQITPTDGTIYTVRNSTNGKGYLTSRVNGTWKSVEIA